MNHVSLALFAAAAVSALTAVPAYSQARPEVLVKQRQSVMVLHGKYFYPIRNMAMGKIPYDPNVVARNAAFVETLARMPWDGFTPATQNIKTQSTAAVFSEPAKFKEAVDRYMAEAAKLGEVARKGDEASIRAQILAVNKTCDSCHESFRERQ
jgi:cytochrome c556